MSQSRDRIRTEEQADTLHTTSNDASDREATELVQRPSVAHVASQNSKSCISAEGPAAGSSATTMAAATTSAPQVPTTTQDWAIARFWRRHIRLTVPHDTCRDHLANERTFLSWTRTALTFSTMAIVTTQLFLIRNPDEQEVSNGADFGKWLGVALLACAIITQICGFSKFWRQQDAIARGKAHTAGLESFTVFFVAFAITAALLGAIAYL